jgi:hypothetical protein
MTIKECREILTKPVPSHLDKRAEVKRGFKISKDKLHAALEHHLGQILQLAQGDVQLLTKLATKATVTWLDFTMHRCRIVIRLAGVTAKFPLNNATTAQKEPVVLTTIPIVGRYGNMKGVELDRFTTIKGYEGATIDIA